MDRSGPVVYRIRRDAKCSECGAPLARGNLLFLEQGRPLCLDCADLGHLEYLPRGDAALTRRSRKHSGLSAVVVEFSRARRRYERQGVLVEPEAVDRARVECLSDSELRAARREREAARRDELDTRYVAAFADEVRRSFPGCPADTAAAIAGHACRKYTGRVGRSAAARRLDPRAVFLAVQAFARHRHTGYDGLLMRGTDRADARFAVRDQLEEVLARWRESPKPDGAS
ncbi:DUF2293 domain-containing protein [candidate division WOR-3 bacterium]|nr:DUF2293 domain-containing protein [candidate division WOR-3 bacterium]